MIHYLIVRRDLPFGDTLAQLSHAAGESFYLLKDPHSKADRTIVAVLGARNVMKLRKLEYKLRALGVPHVAVREPSPPYNGQLTAIGVVPGDREALSPIFKDFQTYQSHEGPRHG